VSLAVEFSANGDVRVRTGKVELGQGLHTALAQVVAEELGVAIERVRMLPVSTDHSPDQGVTSGSLSLQDAGQALRRACAELRGHGHHAVAARLPAAACVTRSVPRLDLPAVLAGQAHFIHDLEPEGLLHGRVLRAAEPMARVLAAEPALAQACAGVLQVLHDGDLLGLVAATSAQADAALARWAPAVRWQAAALAAEDAEDLQRLPATTRVVVDSLGSAGGVGALPITGAAAPAASAVHLQRRYTKPWIAHASLAPSCALALWQGAELQVWTHSQGIFNLRRDLALAFGIDIAAVRVHHVPGAGCYGHNGADDVAFDAAWLARSVPGRSVRVLWSRADELTQSPAGPAMVMELEADFAPADSGARITRWQHATWSPGHSRRPGRSPSAALLGSWQVSGVWAARQAVPASIDMPLAVGGGAERNAVPGYDIAAVRVLCHSVVTQRRSSALRGLGAFGNVFAAESFIDEMAHAAGVCPLSLRRQHLQHDARGLAVLDAAAERAGWAARRAASGADAAIGHGIAYARYKGSGAWCAVVAEVEAGAKLRVRRLTIAVDVGLAVNPDGVVNQIEGGAIQATSWTLLESAAPVLRGWDDYPILRFSEVPAVDVVLMPSSAPSLGAGEASVGPTGAAIANALFDALGVRVRRLPLTPENIVAAMENDR
jgi:CO/xanthine dehydrogenase Mo-binding subunit